VLVISDPEKLSRLLCALEYRHASDCQIDFVVLLTLERKSILFTLGKRVKSIKTHIFFSLSSTMELSYCMSVCLCSNSFRNWTHVSRTYVNIRILHPTFVSLYSILHN
jgi:hypothetical protein